MKGPKLGFVVLLVLTTTVSPAVMGKDETESSSIATALPSHRPLVASAARVLRSVPEPMVGIHDEGELVLATYVAESSVETSAPLVPIERSLVVRPSDGRISQAIKRYAESHGWQLAWEIERDFPIEYPATFTGDFLGIIEQVVLSLQNSDAPIRVKVYEANRVLRVVHATQ